MKHDEANAALREAVRVAGGNRALGRLIGISGQAIRQWERVPAERVAAVANATGVARQRLRPDLYREGDAPPPPELDADPLRTIARRAAARAMHSLLALDPFFLSNETALLLERRLATYLADELKRLEKS
jgi:Bacterial toxin YdaS